MFSLTAFTSTKPEGKLRQPTHHGEIQVFLGSVFTGQRHFFLKMAMKSYIPHIHVDHRTCIIET